MLIPRVFAQELGKLAPTEGRYTIAGVYCERVGKGKARLIETDSSQLVMVDYSDGAAEFPATNGTSVQEVTGFKGVVPKALLAQAAKQVPKRPPQPVLENIGLTESMQGGEGVPIKLVTTDLSSTQVLEGKLVDRQFPPYTAVLPKYRPVTEKDLMQGQGEGASDGHPAVFVTFNAQLLAGVLLAVGAMGQEDKSKVGLVSLRVPLDSNSTRPVEVVATNLARGAEVRGVVMPYRD